MDFDLRGIQLGDQKGDFANYRDSMGSLSSHSIESGDGKKLPTANSPLNRTRRVTIFEPYKRNSQKRTQRKD
jgi:hypothetical protein